MKKDIHPNYQKVLFVDSSTGHKFVCGSSLQTNERDTFEGVEYPVCRISISSSSHPFFTGSKKHADAEGRVDKFKKRYERAAAPADKGNQEESGKEQSSKDQKEKAEKPKKVSKAKKA